MIIGSATLIMEGKRTNHQAAFIYPNIFNIIKTI